MMVTATSLAALMTGFNKSFQDAFNALRATADYTKIATIIKSTSKSQTYGWLGKFPKMREWLGDRVIKDMEAFGYTVVNKKFEATVSVARTDIEDDELGVYAPLMAEMGHGAGEQPDDLVFGLLKLGRSSLCYDGQYFFDADHPGFDATGAVITVSNMDIDPATPNAPVWYLLDTSRPLKPMIFQDRKSPTFIAKTNAQESDTVFMSDNFVYGVDSRCNAGFGLWQLAYVSNKPLNEANLNAAIKRMRQLKASTGRPLGVRPNLLVVGSERRAEAIATVKVAFGEGGKSNPNYQAVEVLDTAWVD